MNAPGCPVGPAVPSLHGLALAALDLEQALIDAEPETQWLLRHRQASDLCLQPAWQAWLEAPPAQDRLLQDLAVAQRLQPAEILAVALASAVETDAMVGRVVAWLQAPVGSSRPTVGLVMKVAEALGMHSSLIALINGSARDKGLLMLESDLETSRLPLPEQSMQVPLPLVLALQNGSSRWPGVELVEAGQLGGAVESLRAAATRQANALRAGGILVVRSGHPREARHGAALVAHALGRRAAMFELEPGKGLGIWLTMSGAIPMFCLELAPGETRKLPALPGYDGPLLVASGPDGSFVHDREPVSCWHVPLPNAGERIDRWAMHTDDSALAHSLGKQHRYDATRIDLLGHAARYEASLEEAAGIARRHVTRAARSGTAADLGSLAELMPDDIGDEAFIIPPPLRDALHALCRRCELREALAENLGPASCARYKPGVRALLVGPSGTGKTLAAGWLATRLGLPLYRVDLASVTSKYIGETEKNLAQLFARAEHAEVILLFDEADALFGKRTEVKESNDRFANAQTNYLLQRIESFEGIAILTSNSRSRFDAAFTRRLDAILDFPQPTPDERRSLWISHLGDTHTLLPGELNRLATACDLAGGHIRNAVLAAAAQARQENRRIGYPDVIDGVNTECRKLGKQAPAGLGDVRGAP